MKTRLIQTAILVLPAMAHAQGLTTGQVYDYAIGDVFQTTDYWCAQGCGSCPPFLYVRDSVTDKQFDVDGYQVRYTFQQQRYRAPGGPFQAEDTTLIYDWGYADSTVYPEHYVELGGGTNCIGPYAPATDTVLSNSLYCGRLHWWRRYEPCDTCFCFGPPSPWSSFFVLGCGGPYWSDVADSPTDVCFGRSLSYYNKSGVECGDEIAMGVGGIIPRRSLTVFPDPADDVLSWSGSEGLVRVEVHSMNGAVVLRAVANDRISVSQLGSGFYVLSITGPGDRTVRTHFVKR